LQMKDAWFQKSLHTGKTRIGFAVRSGVRNDRMRRARANESSLTFEFSPFRISNS
jgi:hypothetical protein